MNTNETPTPMPDVNSGLHCVDISGRCFKCGEVVNSTSLLGCKAEPYKSSREIELERENAALRTIVRDMLHAADDLGIHPKSIVRADGTETLRTERQSGYNDAVRQLGAAMEILAARVNIEADDERKDSWCWTEPLAALQADKARLDWLEHQGNVSFGRCIASPEDQDAPAFAITLGLLNRKHSILAASFRAAIDTAQGICR